MTGHTMFYPAELLIFIGRLEGIVTLLRLVPDRSSPVCPSPVSCWHVFLYLQERRKNKKTASSPSHSPEIHFLWGGVGGQKFPPSDTESAKLLAEVRLKPRDLWRRRLSWFEVNKEIHHENKPHGNVSQHGILLKKCTYCQEEGIRRNPSNMKSK